MITGGSERLRSLRGNDNPYNLDSPATWLDWTPNDEADAFALFASHAFAFRAAHPLLRPGAFWKDEAKWLRTDGSPVNDAYLDSADEHALALLLGGDVYVALNLWSASVTASLPPGKTWALAADTGAGLWLAPGQETVVTAATVSVPSRSVVVLIAK